MLLVLIFGITRLETVESFPSHDSFSSTSAVVNISQEKNLKSLGFVERLHRRSINDCQTTTDTIVTPSCETISSVSNGGYAWKAANVTNYAYRSVKFDNGAPKTLWFKWEVRVNGSSVYMFGLSSTIEPGKYHFVEKVEKWKKLRLSKPQCQPENNLPTIDERCFKVFSSNGWSHVKSGLFVTNKDKKVVLTEDEKLAGEYRHKQQNEC